MVAPPDEQTGKVQTVIGVEVGQQHAHGTGIGMPLKCTKHAAAEVDDQWRRIRRGDQITRSWRIRPDDTAGATQYGYSHAH